VSELGSAVCDVCFRRCRIPEGGMGACRARTCRDGVVVAGNFGRVTSLALDPVEKKPLARFLPGTFVVSVGSYGCNLRCPFCQNHEIAQVPSDGVGWRDVTPEQLVEITLAARRDDPSVTGIAYTYNEPLVGWEYVRDCSELAHEAGLVNVLVSNGCANAPVIDGLAPLIDAANIDYKAFDDAGYRRLGGDIGSVRHTIERLAAEPGCHLEVTTLVVPGLNDDEEGVEGAAAWLASLDDDITYHLTRFFPRWHMSDADPTPVDEVYRLADVARRRLTHVFCGNC
jgi:pyruvate formate lyase activating enzyme